ncbi:unnamed protein product [marine sediment metagenome]|uniref:Uncharacterized protein n=1 Tax=marine sediment metagenome TaxID=412755 RepID=X0WWE9_9ZZZZ
MAEKQEIKRFFHGHFKYEGYELERTSTHIKIKDTKVNRIFELPIANTIIEEI